MTVRFYLYLFSVKLVPKVVHGQRLSKWKNEIIKKSILLLLFIFSYWEWKLHEVLWAQMIDFKLHHCFCLTYKSWHIDSLEYACSHMNDTRLVCSCACENKGCSLLTDDSLSESDHMVQNETEMDWARYRIYAAQHRSKEKESRGQKERR